jgi:kinetochore protein NDC80
MNHMDTKCQKLFASVASYKEDLALCESTLEQLYAEKQALHNTVEAQELSPADVDRMNAERDQLVTSLASCRSNLDLVNQRVWQSEISLQKQMDSLEKRVQEFNAALYKLGHLGTSTPFTGISRELEVDLNASSVENMTSIDLTRSCKPSINAYIAQNKKHIHKMGDSMYALQEYLDKLSWNLAEKQEKVATIRTSVEQSNARYQSDKQVTSELT